MATFHTQADVDAMFSDMDELLARNEPPPQRGCRVCGSLSFTRGSNFNANVSYYDVCDDCGAVAASGYGQTESQRVVRTPVSNYKRIHHWHERISQLLLSETAIPADEFARIAERLLDGTHTVLNKDSIRAVLRSLNMQQYIERWLQIIQRLTGIEPPKPGAALLHLLDLRFTELQMPFKHFKAEGRKNFLNYNFVMCRLLQMIPGCTPFCMFFPLIKSRQKLKALDEMWAQMVSSIGWEVKPLILVAPFAVRLETPATLLERLKQSSVAGTPAVSRPEPWQKGSRKSDQRLIRELDRQKQRAPRRSSPPVLELQTLGSGQKRPRSAWAVPLLRPLQSTRRR